MNSTTYRKFYINGNEFRMIKEIIKVPRCLPCPYSAKFQRIEPRVLSDDAYWVSHNELCTGYHLYKNPNIFRPIFSYERQKILDKLHSSISNPNFSYAAKKYLYELSNLNNNINTLPLLPRSCILIVIEYCVVSYKLWKYYYRLNDIN